MPRYKKPEPKPKKQNYNYTLSPKKQEQKEKIIAENEKHINKIKDIQNKACEQTQQYEQLSAFQRLLDINVVQKNLIKDLLQEYQSLKFAIENLDERYNEFYNQMAKTTGKIEKERNEFHLRDNRRTLESREEVRNRQEIYLDKLKSYEDDIFSIFDRLQYRLNALDKIVNKKPIRPEYQEIDFIDTDGLYSQKKVKKRLRELTAHSFLDALDRWMDNGGIKTSDYFATQELHRAYGYIEYRLSEIFFKNKYQIADAFRDDFEIHEALKEIADGYKYNYDDYQSQKKEEFLIQLAKDEYKKVSKDTKRSPQGRKLEYFWQYDRCSSPFNFSEHVIDFWCGAYNVNMSYYWNNTLDFNNRLRATSYIEGEVTSEKKFATRLRLFRRGNYPLTYANTKKGYTSYNNIFSDYAPVSSTMKKTKSVDGASESKSTRMNIEGIFNPLQYEKQIKLIWATGDYGYGLLNIFIIIKLVSMDKPSDVERMPLASVSIGWVDNKNVYSAWNGINQKVVDRIDEIVYNFLDDKQDYLVKGEVKGYTSWIPTKRDKYFKYESMQAMLKSLKFKPTAIIDYGPNIVLRYDKGLEKGMVLKQSLVSEHLPRPYNVDEILRITIEQDGRINWHVTFNKQIAVKDAYGRNMLMDNIEWLINNINAVDYGDWMAYFRRQYMEINFDGYDYNEKHTREIAEYVRAMLDLQNEMGEQSYSENVKQKYFEYLKRNNNMFEQLPDTKREKNAHNFAIKLAEENPKKYPDYLDIAREVEAKRIKSNKDLQQTRQELLGAQEEYQKYLKSLGKWEYGQVKKESDMSMAELIENREDKYIKMMRELEAELIRQEENATILNDDEEFENIPLEADLNADEDINNNKLNIEEFMVDTEEEDEDDEDYKFDINKYNNQTYKVDPYDDDY